MAEGKIAHDEQFPLWPQCFPLFLTVQLSLMDVFQVFVIKFSKTSAADLMYVGKGYVSSLLFSVIKCVKCNVVLKQIRTDLSTTKPFFFFF